MGANMFLYYVKGNRRKHISPDVMVTLGIAKEPPRDCYLVWEEGKAPDFVLEISSKSTRSEDKKKKLILYRDVLKVQEYILFDPRAEYLDPPLQGFRLIGGDYVKIEPIAGRLPSHVLGLHLERDGVNLRFIDPTTGKRLLSPLEGREEEHRRADDERRRADDEHRRADDERGRADDERRRADDERKRALAAEAAQRNLAEENERLRREIEAMRRG